jgi:tripartite-type tricarboxylate transporter receptor subunit TctC
MNTSVTTIAVRKDAPWNSLEELLRDAKANPKKYNYATSGLGGIQHLAMDILGQKAGVDIVHIPYQGGPQTIQALLGGQVQIVVGDNMHSELKYLATTHPERAALLPQLPTLKELGYDVDLVVRMMVIGPSGLPAPIVSRIEAAIRSAVSDPDVKAKLEARGLEARFEGSRELAQMWQREAQIFKERIEALGLAHYQQPRKQ